MKQFKIKDINCPPEEFAARFRYFRDKIMGWTQRQAAVEFGVTSQTISNWERGRSIPNSDAVIRDLLVRRFHEVRVDSQA